MKKLYTYLTFFALLTSVQTFGQNVNSYCATSLPFCTGTIYNYPAGVNQPSAEVGPNYMCLYSQPNPAWYYMQIQQGGDISIEMHTVPQHDIDFVCWGPFTDPTAPCIAELTGVGSPGSHHAAGAGGGYPAGNTVDCSYDASWEEWCYVPNAQPGEYYIFMITNYSNSVCNIIFNQITGSGLTSCGPAISVSGLFFLDSNNNNIQDPLENGLPNALVLAPTCGYYSQSNSLGNYNSIICSTPDTIWPFYNSPYVTINPPFYELSSPSTNNNFAVSFIPNVDDFSLSLTNYTPIIPGFNTNYNLTVSNIGTISDCGTITLTYDTILNFLSSTPPADSNIGNTLTWNNICLPVLQSESFTITFHVDSAVSLIDTTAPIPAPTTCSLYANITTLIPDTNLANNSDSLTTVVVNSWDPNDKQVSPEGLIDNGAALAEQELEYTIRFQNTGTAPAQNIRIADTLSYWLQVPTFSLVSSSYPCTYNITENGIVQFHFDGINLPDMQSDESGSHGFVKFRIKCKSQLYYGGNVYNTGYIYFDYNQPIITNTTLTYTKAIVTTIPNVKKSVSSNISIEPNPATDFVNINVNYDGRENLNIEILDAQGRSLNKQPLLQGQKSVLINVSKMDAGTYMIRITGKDFSATEPLIKY
jgi:uncharacterized repeat protein (TIGR01451 family)